MELSRMMSIDPPGNSGAFLPSVRSRDGSLAKGIGALPYLSGSEIGKTGLQRFYARSVISVTPACEAQ
jgi:hypothetical protein